MGPNLTEFLKVSSVSLTPLKDLRSEIKIKSIATHFQMANGKFRGIWKQNSTSRDVNLDSDVNLNY